VSDALLVPHRHARLAGCAQHLQENRVLRSPGEPVFADIDGLIKFHRRVLHAEARRAPNPKFVE